MDVPAPFFELSGQFAIDLPGARAVFTTRRGGHSGGPYASLNLGFATDDDKGVQERNRGALAQSVGAPPLAWQYQVHGDEIGVLDDLGQAVDRPRLDGRATRLRGVAPAALAADCLPVAIAGGGAVAIVHAGWRGLASGVIEAGVDAVRDLAAGAGGAGGEPITLTAAIGPGAGPCCYQVGAEVFDAFEAHPEARHEDRIDLKAIAAARLDAAGVAEVYDLGMCTICAPELFFSHRRDRGVTGRQAGLVWLT
jgi:YfiH family protein